MKPDELKAAKNPAGLDWKQLNEFITQPYPVGHTVEMSQLTYMRLRLQSPYWAGRGTEMETFWGLPVVLDESVPEGQVRLGAAIT